MTFHAVRPLSAADLATLTQRVRRRLVRWCCRKGFLSREAAADMLTWQHSGFSVDASVRISLADRDVPEHYRSLEHLLRYCARPAFALERLSVVPATGNRPERVRYTLPRHKRGDWVGPGRARKSTRPGASGGFPADIVRRIKLETQTHELFGIAALGFLATCGGLLRFFDPNKKLDNWLNEVPPTKVAHGRFDIILPAPVIGLCGLAGIIVISVAGCFAYYPEPKEALEELRVASIESSAAAISGDNELCLHWIPICEGWNKRLIVGIYLRKWSVPESILELSKDYENEIEELEHMFQHRSFPSAIRRRAVAVDNARHALTNELYRIGFVDPSDSF